MTVPDRRVAIRHATICISDCSLRHNANLPTTFTASELYSCANNSRQDSYKKLHTHLGFFWLDCSNRKTGMERHIIA